MIKERKIFSSFLCLLVALALVAPAAAACLCGHHRTETEIAETGCHGHTETQDVPDQTNAGLGQSDDCVCAFPAPRASSRFETPAPEKHSAISAAIVQSAFAPKFYFVVNNAFVRQKPPAIQIFVETHSSRGPPVVRS